MQISDLPIPDALKERYITAGISQLYPPQSSAVERGLFEMANLLISIPTASGKTLIAEMAMHSHCARGGKCLYIVPLKALASEKYREFGNKGRTVGLAIGDLNLRDEWIGNNEIIVATSEKVDSFIRNSASWIPTLTLLVIDEVHLIGGEGRGPTLEMVIAKLRVQCPGLQIIGLSATIGNPKKLAEWLGAELVTSTWRPVDLRQGVLWKESIYFREREQKVPQISKISDEINLCHETISDGGQCLIFVSSRKNAESCAKKVAESIKQSDKILERYAKEIEGEAETSQGKMLAACIRKGVGFHHAGLSRAERTIVEDGFREGVIKVISATPTLAAGLNLPARRVIIRDYLRFTTQEGMQPISPSEYHQMAGRAGRPHLDPWGEAILIAKEKDQIESLFTGYIEADAEDIHSHLADPTALYTHLLSLVSSGICHTRGEIRQFMETSFYVYENREGRLLQKAAEKALDFLISTDLIVDVGEYLCATELGIVVSRLSLDPRSATLILDGLREGYEYTDLGLLQLICSTPDMPTLYMRRSDLPGLVHQLEAKHAEIWFNQPLDDEESYYRVLKTAFLLSDWSEELSEAQICERYNIGPGDLHGLVERVTWLIHAAAELSRLFVPPHTAQIKECELCIRHGIKRELLPLITLRGIGRIRARRLFANNMRTPEEIREAGGERLAKILGKGVADQIISTLTRDQGVSVGTETRRGQMTLFTFGDEEYE